MGIDRAEDGLESREVLEVGDGSRLCRRAEGRKEPDSRRGSMSSRPVGIVKSRHSSPGESAKRVTDNSTGSMSSVASPMKDSGLPGGSRVRAAE